MSDKKTKNFSDKTTEAEKLGNFSRKLGKEAADGTKNSANKVAKNPTKALEILPKLSTAAATGNQGAEAASGPSVLKFIYQETSLCLGNIQKIYHC